MTKTATPKDETQPASTKKAEAKAATKDKEIHDDTTKTDATVPQVKVPISVTRLKTVLSKVDGASTRLDEALAEVDALLFGKDESTSSLVLKVREIRDVLAMAQPALADAPGKVQAAITEREEIL
jgi:hypothetical protein